MIWIGANIAFLVIGVLLIVASDRANKNKEDDILEALLCGVGIVCFGLLIVSEPLRWWLG